ncbi:methyl-accepting chemotaxis protein [Duganella fentianensis]|uniref:methyl-accepting chemotaxis protein n=1 Tax=Duganella fentianensis TaxID=2692177 RepID=UPI0032B2BE95
MQWFSDLKIGRKLIVAFAAVIALATLLGLFAIRQLNVVNQASTDIADNWLPSIRTLGEIEVSLARYRISESNHIIMHDAAEFATVEKAMATRLETLRKQQAAYEALISEAEEKRVYGEFRKTLDEYLAASRKLVALSREDKNAEAAALLRGESNKLFRSAFEQLDALVKINDEGSTASDKAADATYDSSRNTIIGVLALLVVVSMALAMYVARIVATPLEEAVGIAGRVAEGDLSNVIVASTRDETGQLMDSLRAMNDSLLKVVGEVRNGTDAIATASAEIASGNMDLSRRTEGQASSLEETASAMEELTSTVQQNADNARQANQLAQSASGIAADGGKVVDEVIATMDSISASSRKIVDIISVIDGIAFQTNILALNAAVEAARAGEQGRGFAVVATEVRNLAQRSAAAAKEIKELIDDSVVQVASGTALVQKAGATMTEVVSSVRRVSDVVAEISAATGEQSTGIGEVNRAITQMDEVTQQNAALVEQAAAAAGAMQEQAANLAEVVSKFRLR